MKIYYLICFLFISTCIIAQENLIQSNPQSEAEQPIPKTSIDTTISKEKLMEIELSASKIDSLFFGIIGGAEIKKIIGSNENNIPANLNLGIVFRQLYQNTEDLKFVSDIFTFTTINFSSSYDSIVAEYNSNGDVTNVSDFGDFILLPANSQYSASSYLTAYFYQDPKKRKDNCIGFSDIFYGIFSGFHAEASAGQKVFVFDTESYNAVGLSLRLGLFHEFIPNEVRLRNNFSIIMGLDFTQRHIFGDIGQNVNDEFRKETFGTDKKSFFGLEPYVDFRFKSLFIETTLPSLWQNENEDVSGLTMTRFIINIKFVGNIPIMK